MQTTTSSVISVLGKYIDWIRETDEHADHHLRLIQAVDRSLDTPDPADPAPVVLAGKLQRWRYQHLHEYAGNLTGQDESFVDALDVVANGLSGRSVRPPRQTRHAIRDESLDTEGIREALVAVEIDSDSPQLFRRARELTEREFSQPVASDAEVQRRRMLLYAPLYVSSQCVNFCTYCGFRYPLAIDRRHLDREQAVEQARVLLGRGFRHLLVVGGEFPSLTSTAYYREILEALVHEGIDPAVEIAPQSTESYAVLVKAGACGVTLYQETYDENLYQQYHIRGPKSNYHWRLESHDRAAEAGISRLGLGVLLGLANPRCELQSLMRHGAYLEKRFPDRRLAFSLPRIHEAPEGFTIPYQVTDEQLIRYYCVLRIAFPRAELVLSTRESASLRDRLGKICITQMSAGSSTTPGGYDNAEPSSSGEQFPISDHRTADDVARWVEQAGMQVAWSTKR